MEDQIKPSSTIKNFDVLVVGAGGGGLNIAQLLAKTGIKVGIVDSKNDLLKLSFHTLGSFIDIKKHDLSPKIIASTVTELIISTKRVHTLKHGTAYILDKVQLHRELLEKCQQNNVEIMTGVTIQDHTQSEKGKILAVHDTLGNKYAAKIFIDCSGIVGVLSKAVGLESKQTAIATGLEYNVQYHAPAYQCHLMFGKLYQGGYGWIFPIQNNRAIIGIGSFDNLARTELKKRLNALCQLPYFKEIITVDNQQAFGGTIPITEIKTKLVSNNLLCIGDSISQVNPLVGEGYRFILDAGLIAAPYIQKAYKANDISILAGYENEWKEKYSTKYEKAKKIQEIAAKISKSDLISDIVNGLISIKKDNSVVDIISSEFKRNIFLP